MTSLDFRQLDKVTHGRVSVGTATLQSMVGIVICISMVIFISTGEDVFSWWHTKYWWAAD